MVDREEIIQKLKNKERLTPEEDRELQINPLNDKEAFFIVEDDEKKIELHNKFIDIRKQVDEGTLTEENLQYLCDTAFGKDSPESKQVYEQMMNSGAIQKPVNTPITENAPVNTTENINNGTFTQSLANSGFSQEAIQGLQTSIQGVQPQALATMDVVMSKAKEKEPEKEEQNNDDIEK